MLAQPTICPLGWFCCWQAWKFHGMPGFRLTTADGKLGWYNRMIFPNQDSPFTAMSYDTHREMYQQAFTAAGLMRFELTVHHIQHLCVLLLAETFVTNVLLPQLALAYQISASVHQESQS